jgi:hypothetical protein
LTSARERLLGLDPRQRAGRGAHSRWRSAHRRSDRSHDVLAVLGIRELQRYLVDKIHEVYRSQPLPNSGVGVGSGGKDTKVRCEQVDRFRCMEENEKVMNRGGEPASGTPLLLGITKASLSTDSFISAAWFRVRWTDAGVPPVECARANF